MVISANLDVDTLRAMVTCCIDSLIAVKVDGQPTVGVQCDPVQLLRFLSCDFAPMNMICDQGQMFERRIYDRSKAVFEYFGLPFDAEPPR